MGFQAGLVIRMCSLEIILRVEEEILGRLLMGTAASLDMVWVHVIGTTEGSAERLRRENMMLVKKF